MIEVSKAFSEKQEAWSNGYRAGLKDALTALERLESECKVYHSGSDYWRRGVRYTLDVIEEGEE